MRERGESEDRRLRELESGGDVQTGRSKPRPHKRSATKCDETKCDETKCDEAECSKGSMTKERRSGAGISRTHDHARRFGRAACRRTDDVRAFFFKLVVPGQDQGGADACADGGAVSVSGAADRGNEPAPMGRRGLTRVRA